MGKRAVRLSLFRKVSRGRLARRGGRPSPSLVMPLHIRGPASIPLGPPPEWAHGVITTTGDTTGTGAFEEIVGTERLPLTGN
jgi:hypothetical protein